MTIFLSDMETCFVYMLLLPMGVSFIGIVALVLIQCDYVNIRSYRLFVV